ncbi:MAG: hypothetical protein A3I24_02730 [Candidatus Harrisonbacteria bacterium RIFCSPLOWO2_02_FULL_41_13b]|uniref:Methyltransferase type 11 domain-containing protein n=1 Tax=Candidatus Harrisonbacteria bacterium RIFCSPLOWO2_02_FULL_41_13b TaxID=1798409 RepID=A0A1G1ZRH3_9BACT|nr:MAG: hypothetical protein A3J53_02140 [Candidatus Harrisonbacteria bacterium RIFCSPHIGHO2_02_FULL_40_20]OGY67071.1 MAG: hypothetical protein A3I24_02730 [Candidatus Harrisonbacteria bacterium RIFCSPLOWO2_02_FULL_41_13b]
MSDWKKDNLRFLLNKLGGYPDNFQILDLGVGKDPFSEATVRFKNVVKMDILPYDAVNLVGDFNKGIPFKNNHFDCVLVNNVLEHCSTPPQLLREINRVLKPGGVLIGTVPFIIQIHQEPHDYFRYTEYCLRNLFKDAGFKDCSINNLGHSLSIYNNFQGLFFWKLLNSPLNIFEKTLIKIIWKGQRILIKLMGKIYQKCLQDDILVQGYGFVVEK